MTRQDLRDSIHCVDHANTVARCSTIIQRCLYTVTCPNAVWHMDSHHKLIQWRIITHAAIDGFSYTILYAVCTNNNKATTLLSCFLDGVSVYGLPQGVRSDHGGENIEVWKYMIIAHGGDISCVLTGSSTHNEHIERLWRDVHRSVTTIASSPGPLSQLFNVARKSWESGPGDEAMTTTYAEVFCSLENESLLDPLNEVDIYCLHFVYLPQIQKSLTVSKFMELPSFVY